MARRCATVGAVLMGVALAGGCQSKAQWQGRGDVLAVYRGTTLTAEFPEQVAVHAVVAAAETSLRSRGYAITSTEATSDRGRVVGEQPNAGAFEQVVVSARLSKIGTRVQVTQEPLGGEAISRAILDDMLARLGY